MVRARFGNVAGILVCTEERPGEISEPALTKKESSRTSLGVGFAADAADALAQVFDEAWVVGFAGIGRSAEREWNLVQSESGSPVERLRSALACTEAPRVFVQAGAASLMTPIALDVLLAAIAWPEGSLSLIGVDDSTSPHGIAIGCRSALMAAASEAAASGETSVEGVLARGATERLSLIDLGVSGPGVVGLAGRLNHSSPRLVEGNAGGGC